MRELSLEKQPTVFGIKSPTIWITSRKNPSSIYPICYIRKPKNVDQAEFDAFIDSISILCEKAFLEERANG